MKICTKCQAEKPESEYYKVYKNSNKLLARCKTCISENQKKNKKTNRIRHKLDNQTIDFLIDLYCNKNYNIRYIAKNYGFSKKLISKALKLRNINVKHTNYQRKHKIMNENYFEIIDTEEKAYFLGFLWADGCNYRVKNVYQIVLSLQERDKEIVEKLCDRIFNNRSVISYIIKNNKDGFKRQNQYRLRICSKLMSNNLLEKGMVPRKSLILEWPKELPEHLISHFIRGYLDGDGCISFNNNSKSFMVGFFSSHKFCEQLNNYFIAKLNMKFSSTKKNKITTLKIHGNPKSKKFLDWIYNGSTIYLSRKYAKYQDLNSYLQNLP